MDIKIHGAQASGIERAAIDRLLGEPVSGWDGGERDIARDGRFARGGQAARERRDLLLPALHALQDRVGWVSEGGLNYVCERLTIPPADAWGVVTFYHLFSTEPRAPAVAHVCDDLACRLAGSNELCRRLEGELGPAGSSSASGESTWIRSACLGLCELAPAALVLRAGELRESATLAPVRGEIQVAKTLDADTTEHFTHRSQRLANLRKSVPQAGSDEVVLLARIGVADPDRLGGYRSHGGFEALTRAIEIGREAVIAELSTSRLLGRGGAAFPAGRKWAAVASTRQAERFVVCNADESEPGTFKDRVLLEEDPFAIVEALIIAGFAVRAERGFIYLRGEYPRAETRLQNAIAKCRQAGWLGPDVAGAGFAFDIEIRRGAGAYICGEETALFNSIEGKRGEPRSKPPFPVEAGLFGRPTLVNNVETLVNVLPIVLHGGERYAGIGTEGSTGTKLFCVSGRVRVPGVYEVPFGITLRGLLELAGGIAEGATLRAVLMGGAAGSFVGPEALGMPLTFEGTRAAGTTLGSGVVMVFAEGDDLGDALLSIARFFRHESCGQCVPCRVGTMRQEELLERLRSGRLLGSHENEMQLFAELAQAMRDASICGLGQTAASAIDSALVRFRPFGF